MTSLKVASARTSAEGGHRDFAQLVDADLIDKAWSLSNGNVHAQRALDVKISEMFNNVGENRDLIMGAIKSGGINKKETVEDIKADWILRSVDMTWGAQSQQLDPEYKLLVIEFMMDAVIAMDSWGFIPWYVRYVESRAKRKVVHKIPAVATPGTFNIRQILAKNGLDVTYVFEPLNRMAGRLAQDGPFDFTEEKIRQIQLQSKAVLGGSVDESSLAPEDTISVTNQAQDGTPENISHRTYGVYMIKSPTYDGYPRSPAVSCLTAAHMASEMSEHALTASAIASCPPVVIERNAVSGSDKGAFANASSLIKRGDLTQMKFASDLERNAMSAAILHQHNTARAKQAEGRARSNAEAFDTIYDATSRKKKQIVKRAFYENNGYDVPDGYSIVHQQMPVVPTCLADFRRWEEEHIARAYGIPYSALSGETGRVGVNAEVNQAAISKKVFSQASIIAMATTWILNFINEKSDTMELKVELDLVKARTGKSLATKDLRRKIRQDLYMTSRYQIRVTRPLPPIELIEKIRDRGFMSREAEAAVSMAIVGLPSEYIQLQDYPNPNERPEKETATAKKPSSAK
jgi:hypothetical protein